MSGRHWAVRGSLLTLLALVLVVAIGSTASAQIVVGQVDPVLETESSCFFEHPYDEFQISVASGNSYVVPTAGVITSWSTKEGPAPGPIGVKIFRPLGLGTYLVVGHDGPRPLTPNSLNTFPVSIPVQAGDILGLSVLTEAPSNCAFRTALKGDVIGYREGLAADGQVLTEEDSFSESRLNISATLLPPPTVSSITPATGSIEGASVVIAGSNFASVQGVSFGSVPAVGFTVDSEGQITAKAPASKTLGKVPVTVTTVAGTATSAQTFAYEGCAVPKLKGKRLKAAKKKARAKDCKIGKVKKLGDATAKSGKVVKQNPRPGKVLPPGSKIKLTIKG